MSKEIVVLSAVRTPMGGFQGSLSGLLHHNWGRKW